MSQLYTTTYICDQCGVKLVVDDLAMPQPGEPGWWYLRFPVNDGTDMQNIDFCSAACLVKWVSEQEGDDGRILAAAQ